MHAYLPTYVYTNTNTYTCSILVVYIHTSHIYTHVYISYLVDGWPGASVNSKKLSCVSLSSSQPRTEESRPRWDRRSIYTYI